MSAYHRVSQLYDFQLPNGEFVRLTSREAVEQYGVSQGAFLHKATKAGRCMANFEKWIDSKPLASVFKQPAKVSGVHDLSLFILWDYQNRQNPRFVTKKVGVKWLAKQYRISPSAVTQLLIDHGMNPSERTTNMVAKHSPNDAAKHFYANKMKNSLPAKIRRRIMNRVQNAIKGLTVNMEGWFSHVGCSVEELKKHIEAKFESGMKWENYGKVWEIDHIKPCASFDLTKKEEFSRCFHYSNLQPLSVSLNRKKGARNWDAKSRTIAA